jgi:sugar phosphate isomerase/epimerase
MGIAATSFGGAIYGAPRTASKSSDPARERALATVPTIPGAPGSRHADTLDFLERCHALGASGVQTHINGDVRAVRKRSEELGMWVEAMFAVRNSTPEQLEQAISDAKAAGCSIARDAMLSGRRYETFNSLAEWNDWVRETHRVIERVLPALEKHRFTLAVENHKDWTADEYAQLFKKYSSEYLGGCVDLGNNISLLDDPTDLVEAAAPFAKATHIKDMAVQAEPDGFAMSEVPLGTGVLDLQTMFSALTKANPRIHFALEMITRDPLRVPCLTDHYWITFPDRNGRYLARTLRYVEEHKAPQPLPVMDRLAPEARAKLETENIRTCFDYARKAPS